MNKIKLVAGNDDIRILPRGCEIGFASVLIGGCKRIIDIGMQEDRSFPRFSSFILKRTKTFVKWKMVYFFKKITKMYNKVNEIIMTLLPFALIKSKHRLSFFTARKTGKHEKEMSCRELFKEQGRKSWISVIH